MFTCSPERFGHSTYFTDLIKLFRLPTELTKLSTCSNELSTCSIELSTYSTELSKSFFGLSEISTLSTKLYELFIRLHCPHVSNTFSARCSNPICTSNFSSFLPKLLADYACPSSKVPSSLLESSFLSSLSDLCLKYYSSAPEHSRHP